jgi:TRAP-type C4-dicarboxylate transport system substrate-binding protein
MSSMGLRANYLIIGVVAVLFATAAPGAPFKLATVAPEGSQWMQELRAGADELSAATEGRVKLKFYTGGVMGNDKKVLRKIRIGQLQGGAFTSSGLSERYRDIMVYGIPLLFRDQAEVDFVRERLDPTLEAGLEEAGLVSLGFAGGGFAKLMGASPVNSLEQLRGQKIWVPEGDQVTYVSLDVLSLSPVVLPITDVLTGLQTGLIDYIATPPVAAVLLQWYTKVSYITDFPLAYTLGVLAVDKKPFSRLSAADQSEFRDIMGRAYARVDAASRVDNVSADAALLENGLSVIDPGEAEFARWQQLRSKVLERLGGDGVVSEAILSELDDYLQDYRQASSAATIQTSAAPAE